MWVSRRVEDVGYSILDMMPCRLVERFYTLNMDAANYVENMVSSYESTRRHIIDDNFIYV
jgi:RNase adaptor protein for sRNA GlmZ degradation